MAGRRGHVPHPVSLGSFLAKRNRPLPSGRGGVEACEERTLPPQARRECTNPDGGRDATEIGSFRRFAIARATGDEAPFTSSLHLASPNDLV